MPDSYEVLYSKYQRALASVRELERQKEFYEKELESLRDSSQQMEDSCRVLCETILKKDREIGKGKNDVWFKKNTTKLIQAAQESLERYFPSKEEMIRKLLEHAHARTQKIASLMVQIKEQEGKHAEEIRQKDEAIEKLRKIIGEGKEEAHEAEKIIEESTRKPTDLEHLMEVEEEDGDDLSDVVETALDDQAIHEDIITYVAPGPKVKLQENSRENVKKKIHEVANRHVENVEICARGLKDLSKHIIKVMGETGISELTPLIVEARLRNNDIPSDSRIKAYICEMRKNIREEKDTGNGGNAIIETYKCPAPGSGNLMLYKLSPLGRDIFHYLFGKDAVEPEMERIRKAHDNYEHGYGIKKTAILIKNMECVREWQADIIFLTRRKEYVVQISENEKYIPDIIITFLNKKGKEIRYYIEYETGKCNDSDFIAKCNKMAVVSPYINFVVPKNDEKAKLLAQVEKWRKQISNTRGYIWSYPKIVIRVATFKELQDGDSRKSIPWPTETTINKPKDRG